MVTLENLLEFAYKKIICGELNVVFDDIEHYGLVKQNNNQILIVIKKNLSDDKVKETLIHELVHVYLGHCHLTPNADEMETERITKEIWKGGNIDARICRTVHSKEWR